MGRSIRVTSQHGIHLSLGVSLLAGMGIFLMFVWNVFAKERRRREELEISAPNEKLLRPPGHSLQEKLFDLVDEANDKTLEAVLAAAVGLVLLYPAVATFSSVTGYFELLRDAWMRSYLALSVLCLGGAVFCGIRAYAGGKRLLELKQDIRNRRLGLRGEQAVAEVLHSREVAGNGYLSFHDVPKENGGNIDHVVIGPGGVFVIETKARSQQKPRPRRLRHQVKFNGNKAEFPSGGYDFEAPKQTRRNIALVSGWIRSVATNTVVEGFLVYPGWRVDMTQPCEGVKAVSLLQLQHCFEDLKERLSSEQIDAIRKLFERRCRDVPM